MSFVLSPLTWAGSGDPILEGKSAAGTFSTVDTTGDVTVGSGGDPADAGAIRLKNADKIVWEASPAGTDVEGIAVDANEIVQIGAAGASGVTITPALTLTGGQIAFPATAVPSGDANTLDDYEEGTFTPTITFGGAAVDITYNATYTLGEYTKIGNRVLGHLRVLLTNKGTSNGTFLLETLPFTVLDNTRGYYPVSLYIDVVSFADFLFGQCLRNTTTISIRESTNAGSNTSLDDSNVANISSINASFSYEI